MEPSQSYDHHNQTVILTSRAFDAAKLHLFGVKLRIAQTTHDYESAAQAYSLAKENFNSKAEELSPFEYAVNDCYDLVRDAQAKYDEILSNLGPEPHLIDQAKLAEIKQASDNLKHAQTLRDEALKAQNVADIPLNELREDVRKARQVCDDARRKRDEAKAELATAEEEVASTDRARTDALCARC